MELKHTFTVPAPIDEAWAVLRDIERIAPCMPGASIDSVEEETFSGRVKVKVGPMTVTYRGSAKFAETDEDEHRAVIEASGKEARGSGTARATVTATLTEQAQGETEVVMTTDLAITGKPAQFGRGVMDDVGRKLIGQFADCLSEELSAKPPPEAEAAPAASEAAVQAAAGATVGAAPTTPEGTPPSAPPEPAPTVLDESPPVAPDQTPPAGAEAGAPAAPRAAPAAAETGGPAGRERPRPEPEAIDLLGVAGAPVAKRLAPVAAAAAVVALVVWLVRRRSRRAEEGRRQR